MHLDLALCKFIAAPQTWPTLSEVEPHPLCWESITIRAGLSSSHCLVVLKRPTYTNAHTAEFRPRGRQSCSSTGDGKVTGRGTQMRISLKVCVYVCVCVFAQVLPASASGDWGFLDKWRMCWNTVCIWVDRYVHWLLSKLIVGFWYHH